MRLSFKLKRTTTGVAELVFNLAIVNVTGSKMGRTETDRRSMSLR